MDFELKESYTINDLLDIMKLLRGENGCPWDKEQNHQSIRKNFIEETYEVCEAIDEGNPAHLKEELGDVLLQIVFHSQMEEEQSSFSFADVVNDICCKLIVRHPHVFSNTTVGCVQDVLNNWADIKQQTKGQTTATQTLQSVPTQLPALMRCDKVQGRAIKANQAFGADTLEDIRSKINELEAAVLKGDTSHISDEIGEVLFATVNVAHHFHMDAEELLSRSTDKFIDRFSKAEKLAEQNEIDFKAADSKCINALWKEAENQN